tara:strand:- start:456 stop:653 length:198 start_codon:yes stop_codon:yes gene_type:complete
MKLSFINRLTSHLKDSKLSYISHMKRASKISFFMCVGSIVCFIHGIFPFLFETTGTSFLEKARNL